MKPFGEGERAALLFTFARVGCGFRAPTTQAPLRAGVGVNVTVEQRSGSNGNPASLPGSLR